MPAWKSAATPACCSASCRNQWPRSAMRGVAGRSFTIRFMTSVEVIRWTLGSAESFVLQAPAGRWAGGDNAKQKVRVTEEPLGREHVREGRDSFFDAHEGAAIFLAHGDEDEHLERQAEGVRGHMAR